MVARQPQPAKPEHVLSTTARRQHGVFTRRQALAAGFTHQAIKTRLTNGSFVRVLRGVYRFGAAPRSWKQDVLAVVIWAGDDAVASHGTAAKLWRFPVAPAWVEITVPARRDPPNRNIRIHRGRVPAKEIVDGIAVTTAARTLLDIADRVDAGPLETMIDDAIARRIATTASLEWELAMSGGSGRYGSARFRKALAHLRDGHCESPLENKVLRVLLAAGLPLPLRQYEIRDPAFTARVDFAYPDAKVAIEVDSYEYHSSRTRFDDDRRRDARLKAIDWQVIRVTDRALADPSPFIAAVRAARRDALF